MEDRAARHLVRACLEAGLGPAPSPPRRDPLLESIRAVASLASARAAR